MMLLGSYSYRKFVSTQRNVGTQHNGDKAVASEVTGT